MQFVQRKITYRMYPNATELAALDHALGLHCRVTNTLLEEHRRRYEANEPGFNFTAMCQAITRWRQGCAALAKLNAQSLQVTAKRVNLAFEAFFRRIKAGETPGYPRFKSFRRFSGWGYKTYGDGWKLHLNAHEKQPTYARIALSGIGNIRLRGRGRFLGTPKTCEVLHRQGKWYLSVTFNVAEHQVMRPGGKDAAAFDWGLKTLLTIAKTDGSFQEIDNPHWLKGKLAGIKSLQHAISTEETRLRAQLGKQPDERLAPSQLTAKLKRLYAQLRAIHGKVARQRKDFYHKLTAGLVEEFGFLGTEELAVKNMTRRPKKKQDAETQEYLPNGASHKAGLNRSILDAAPSMLLQQLRYKALEAGGVYAEANTKKVKPTQRCSQCGQLVPKELSEREHRCPHCHCTLGRDENAARTLLRWLIEGEAWFGKEPKKKRLESGAVGLGPPETLLIAAPAAWSG